MNTFGKYLRAILNQGANEAQKDGSATVEAHHLLLAIAADKEPGTRKLLTSVGLDYRVIREALDREFEQSLGAAGVTFAAADLPRLTKTSDRPPHLGASVRLVLERGLKSVVRKGDLQPAHLLLGILQARVGTVPRALAVAGVNQAEATERVRQALTKERQ